MKTETLNKDFLYIVSFETLKKNNIFSYFIRFCFQYLSKNKPKHIINHSGLLIHYNNEWILCEIGYNKEQHYIFNYKDVKKSQNCHFHEIGKVSSEEKAYILKKYKNKRINNLLKQDIYSITSLLFSYPYPVWSALASFEIAKIPYINALVNYILNIIRDINNVFLYSIFQMKQTKFCSQSVIETIFEINFNRIRNDENLFVFSVDFYNLLEKVKFDFEEITPQDIFDTFTVHGRH